LNLFRPNKDIYVIIFFIEIERKAKKELGIPPFFFFVIFFKYQV